MRIPLATVEFTLRLGTVSAVLLLGDVGFGGGDVEVGVAPDPDARDDDFCLLPRTPPTTPVIITTVATRAMIIQNVRRFNPDIVVNC